MLARWPALPDVPGQRATGGHDLQAQGPSLPSEKALGLALLGLCKKLQDLGFGSVGTGSQEFQVKGICGWTLNQSSDKPVKSSCKHSS